MIKDYRVGINYQDRSQQVFFLNILFENVFDATLLDVFFYFDIELILF